MTNPKKQMRMQQSGSEINTIVRNVSDRIGWQGWRVSNDGTNVTVVFGSRTQRAGRVSLMLGLIGRHWHGTLGEARAAN